ncbi:DUF6090 family protein [Gaetbulibacter sp. M235]|uniref:DUF6090 family protein n=1 Tax=Gaetbulibacter sp. M235 TaxID=3126510 RepID=UPI00374E7071
MIKLFRNIRKKLVTEGKTANYLKYAIGEIVLVVIGILIALQINTWNDNKKEKREEQLIIKNLNLEFQKNKKELQFFIQHHDSILATTKTIMSLIGASDDVLKSQNIDSLIYQSIDYWSYNPSQSVVSDLVSSGKLNLISSSDLRQLIFDWSSKLDEKKEAYSTIDEVTQSILLIYLTRQGSMKNIDRYSFLKWKKTSNLNRDNFKLFQDFEFENNMDNQAWNLANYISALKNLEKVIDDILAKTNSNP